MTRRGSFQRPWTTDELDRLRDMAGRIPRRDICRELRRSTGAVKMAASRLGLSLRCRTTRLVLCCECGSYRSAVDKRHGKCRVCRMRDQLQGREWACGEEMARMTPEQRDVYERNESRRGTKPSSLGPRPVLGESCVLSRYERQKAKTAYLLALEEWEYRRLMLPYDAAKKRLQRMREVTGTNPRKSKK